MQTVGATILTVFIDSLPVLDAERATGDVRCFDDAMSWAFVALTAVGYGDRDLVDGLLAE